MISGVSRVLVNVEMVKYFKREINSKSKYHIAVGHQTIMGTLQLLRPFEPKNPEEWNSQFKEAVSQQKSQGISSLIGQVEFGALKICDKTASAQKMPTLAIITLEKPMFAPRFSRFIGSKLDLDSEGKECRLGFYGLILEFLGSQGVANKHEEEKMNTGESGGAGLSIKVAKIKEKKGVVERVIDGKTLLVKDMFSKETNLQVFLGKPVKVIMKNKEEIHGCIASGFGQSGKVKLALDSEIYSEESEKKLWEEKLVGAEAFASIKIDILLK